MHRPFTRAAAVVLCAATLAACGTSKQQARSSSAASSSAARTLTVAAFNFTESQILANLFAQALDAAGLPARVKTMTTREAVEPALWRGEVDVVPEYTSSLASYLNAYDNGASAPKVTSSDLAATMSNLRSLAQRHHVAVLDPSQARNENAFAVTAEFAEQHSVATLSDLAAYRGPLALGGPRECATRPYCKPGLEKTYGLMFTTFRALDTGGPLTKLALGTGLVQVGLVFSSDPGIAAYQLRMLTDDRHLQDVDAVVPAVYDAAATPALTAALNRLMSDFTTADLTQLNAKVGLQHQDPADVARAYLAAKGIVSRDAAAAR